MTLVWETLNTARPNRYLDWQHRNVRSDQRRDQLAWCSVMIEIQKGRSGRYLNNLIRLRQEINKGYSDREGGEDPTVTMRMLDDELAQLDDLIERIERTGREPTDAVDLWFFIYLPEDAAYERGQYAHKRGYYEIQFVGPPLEGFTTERQPFRPTALDETKPAGLPIAVGIIDDGIGFAHERFRISKGDGAWETRIQAIWLQNLEKSGSGGGVTFGSRLDKSDIDALLDRYQSDSTIYREAGQLDFGKQGHKSLARRTSHGTHVLDLAAGRDPKTVSGLREYPIFAVQLPTEATADTSGITMESYVLQAARAMMLWADRYQGGVPLVINFSYGILAGPKDGSHVLERVIDRLISRRNRTTATTRVVLPSGNSFRNRDTAEMHLIHQKAQTIEWMVQPDDRTANYLEIWFNDPGSQKDGAPVQIELRPPTGPVETPPLPGDGKVNVLKDGDAPVAALYYDKTAAITPDGTRRSRIFIAVNPTHSWHCREGLAPAGVWTLTVTNTAPEPLTAHLYIQRDDSPVGYPGKSRRSFFGHRGGYERDEKTGNYTKPGASGPITRSGTLSAIANGKEVYVIGSAEDVDAPSSAGPKQPEAGHPPPTDYTSSGPTPGRSGPEVSAISDEGTALRGILAAGTYSGSVVRLSGTSVAAPQVTRWLSEHANSLAGIGDAQNSWPVSLPLKPRLGKCVLKKPDRSHLPPRKYPVHS